MALLTTRRREMFSVPMLCNSGVHINRVLKLDKTARKKINFLHLENTFLLPNEAKTVASSILGPQREAADLLYKNSATAMWKPSCQRAHGRED